MATCEAKTQREVLAPLSLAALLGEFRGCFSAWTYPVFCALACGLLSQRARRTVCGMLVGAQLSATWSHYRAHRFFSHARWSLEAVSAILAKLVVRLAVADDAAVAVAIDDTLFLDCGPLVHAASWFHDGSGKGKKKTGHGFLVSRRWRVGDGWRQEPVPDCRAPVCLGRGRTCQLRVRWEATACGHPLRCTMVAAHPHRGSQSSGTHQGHVLLGPVPAHRSKERSEQGSGAVAHSILETVWHLLTTGAFSEDPGADYFERRHDPTQQAKRLCQRIEALGFAVTAADESTPEPVRTQTPVRRCPGGRIVRRAGWENDRTQTSTPPGRPNLDPDRP